MLSPTIHHSADTGHRGIAVCAMDDQIFMTITIFWCLSSLHLFIGRANLELELELYVCFIHCLKWFTVYCCVFVINVVYTILIAIYKTVKVFHKNKYECIALPVNAVNIPSNSQRCQKLTAYVTKMKACKLYLNNLEFWSNPTKLTFCLNELNFNSKTLSNECFPDLLHAQ